VAINGRSLEKPMPLYAIRRELGTISRDELDASASRAIMCAYDFENMTWVRSFWDPEAGNITCLYEAASAEDIREHARRARIPCDDVREVTEVTPELYVHG
jgi:hypothetical protein